jgi:hypothetical protein
MTIANEKVRRDAAHLCEQSSGIGYADSQVSQGNARNTSLSFIMLVSPPAHE